MEKKRVIKFQKRADARTLNKIFGEDFSNKVQRFRELIVHYTQDPGKADIDKLLRLADETCHDFYSEGERVTHYHKLLHGDKDQHHYLMLALDVYDWGYEDEAIEYLTRGINDLGAEKATELIPWRDGLKIFSTYVGIDGDLKEQIYMAARCDDPILIEGETGTGKEVAARLIHKLSPRDGNPFVPINCAAISPELVESELFGHLKGAFTGASENKVGLFETADGGTLFLDEINDIDLRLQAKLLRFLQNNEITPVGGAKSRDLDVRVICATNQFVGKMIKEMKLREDFYYRIAAITVSLPPLRERREVIPELAQYFVSKRVRYKDSGRPTMLSPDTILLLQQYDWPGNVRQLENLLSAIVATTHNLLINPRDIEKRLNYLGEPVASLNRAVVEDWSLERWTNAYTEIILAKCAGNKTAAAGLLHIHRTTLNRSRKKHRENKAPEDKTIN